MSTPNHICHHFNTLPAWAEWIAQDADGTWWAYQAEPNQRDHGWYENEVGDCIKITQTATNPDWEQAIYKISDICHNI